MYSSLECGERKYGVQNERERDLYRRDSEENAFLRFLCSFFFFLKVLNVLCFFNYGTRSRRVPGWQVGFETILYNSNCSGYWFFTLLGWLYQRGTGPILIQSGWLQVSTQHRKWFCCVTRHSHVCHENPMSILRGSVFPKLAECFNSWGYLVHFLGEGIHRGVSKFVADCSYWDVSWQGHLVEFWNPDALLRKFKIQPLLPTYYKGCVSGKAKWKRCIGHALSGCATPQHLAVFTSLEAPLLGFLTQIRFCQLYAVLWYLKGKNNREAFYMFGLFFFSW